ncbi:MAG: hypothetical protein V5783_05995 [Pontiella sp.]
MLNRNKRSPWNAGTRTLSLLGVGLMLSFECFSQTNINRGTNEAVLMPGVMKRDPFWPVGYVPERFLPDENENRNAKKLTKISGWAGAMKKVVINGVSSRANNNFFAVINGQIKRVNDTVSIRHGGNTYAWVVVSIQLPSSVQLRRVSAL